MKFSLHLFTLFSLQFAAAKEQVCLTKPCQKASQRIQGNMNPNMDPCKDFEEFACGGWRRRHSIPKDKGQYGQVSILRETLQANSRRILDSPVNTSDFESYNKAKIMYRSCMNTSDLEARGLEPLKEVLSQMFGGWPVLQEHWNVTNFDPWRQIIKMYQIGHEANYLLSFQINADVKNTSAKVLYINHPRLDPSKEYLDQGWNNSVVRAYYKFMVDTAVLFGANETKAKEEMAKVLEFEMQLSHISMKQEQSRNQTLLYNAFKLQDLDQLLGLPTTSWTQFIHALLDIPQLTIGPSEKVIIRDLGYFQNLSRILASTDQKVVANYLAWKLSQGSLHLLNQAARHLKQTFDMAFDGNMEPQEDWVRCIQAVGFDSFSDNNLVFAASSLYAKAHSTPEAKSKLLDMVNQLKEAFKEMIENLEWMDALTKEKALEKLTTMKQFIAYPDELLNGENIDAIYEDLRFDPFAYFQNMLSLQKHMLQFSARQLHDKVDPFNWREHRLVAVVNAFYNPSLNAIEFPLGFLGEPFYSGEEPMYLSFGAIGHIMGHEITHGFDDRGKQKNAQGNLENWWQPETDAKFRDKAQCFIWQYGNYTDDQIGKNLNGVNTLGENIADNGGLKEAYLAYSKWVKEHGEEGKLPDLPYSQNQLFWLSFAQKSCGKYSDQALSKHILTSVHAPAKFRVWGPISNNEDFARDFSCAKGSKMNPAKKCFLW